MTIRKHWFVIPLIFVAAAIAVVLLFSSMQQHAIQAQRSNLMAAAARYPRFTVAQRMAVLRELQAEKHPQWKDLNAEGVARILAALTANASNTQPALANFMGNVTAISAPAGDIVGMARQSNCSLTMKYGSYTIVPPNLMYTVTGQTANYDQVLHSLAGLTTTGGKWPSGCSNAVLGATSDTVIPMGLSSGGYKMYAGTFYNASTGDQDIDEIVANGSDNSEVSSNDIPNLTAMGLATADLNKDGNPDLVTINDSGSGTGGASISVLLGKADGTLQDPVNYSLPTDQGISVVIDDFNGDGVPDIVASSYGTSSNFYTYELSFLAGKGDGTFAAPQSVTVTPPSGFNNSLGAVPYYGLISVDLVGNGKKDLVTSAGIVLMGNGDGTFTQATSLAFPTEYGTSSWSPDVVAADFNGDGKVDLAVSNGESIQTYLGNGSGAFTAGPAYATIDNIGYLSAADLDGDGNIDIYSGAARAGDFGGDKFEPGQAYALMNEGNGAFAGAPELPFVFTGTNLADLNQDKVLDGVGLNAPVNGTTISFTSYLGNANGTFTTGPTLTVSPITLQGNSYSLQSIDSYGLGDVNGDGNADLVYLSQGFYGPNLQTGYFLATGKGDGSFNAPVFIPAPSLVPGTDVGGSELLSGLWVADVNGDGKADVIYSYSVEDNNTSIFYQGIAVQLSNGDGTFQNPQLIQTYSSANNPPGQPPAVAQIGDTRANGVPDLLALQSTTSGQNVTVTLLLYLGKGDGTFTLAANPKVADQLNPASFGSAVGQIVLADMNGDGKPDLVTMGTSSDNYGEVAISLGNGDGTFAAPVIQDFGAGSTEGFGLAVADFNGDGKPDVAVSGFNPPFDTGILLGNGDGTLQTFNAGNGIIEPAQAIDLLVFGAALATDWNGDGKPDLVAGSAILLNLGTSSSSLTATTTALTASATSVSAGQNVTFTATVSASSTPGGSVTFNDGSTALGTGTLNGSGVATFSTTSLGVGSHSITAVYAGNSTYAGSTSTPVTVSVTAAGLAPTTTTLAATASTLNVGSSVTFNATVAPSSGSGTPTGTLTFLDGTTTLGTANLTSGAGSFSTSSLGVGVHSITAMYGGDSNFAGSTSSAVSVTVQSLTPTFAVAASPTSGAVNAGQTAQTTITVTPSGGFDQQVSFACNGLPSGAACSFSPATVTPNGAAASTALSITTATQSTALRWIDGFGSGRGMHGRTALAFVAGGALWFFLRRRKDHRSRLPLGLVVLIVAAGAASGCGHSKAKKSQQSQNYSVTITATAGSQSQTAVYTLTVQ